jgi:aminoglycoside/choline kinase family phosphotransferase
MSPRPELLQHVATSRPGALLEPMAGDASTRRFWRERSVDGESRVIMDYGEPFSGETDDVRLTRLFLDAGLPVAELLAVEAELGCLWFEDLGPLTLEAALAAAEQPERLLSDAVRLAARIADDGSPRLAQSARNDGPALDEARFEFEMRFFVEHYVEGLCGKKASVELRQGLQALAREAARTPQRVLCHRDYHSRNLMLRSDGRLAMVDIQDAQWGPDSYDLASLLFDAYIEIDSVTRDRLFSEYVTLTTPQPGFEERFSCVALERTIKALGTFGYQASVKHNERYLEAVPRTLTRIDTLLARVESAKSLALSWKDAGLSQA